ncbi:905_t:CDS:2 [Acaulospora colombiana]|uniref:905_t:CDS:1 n=1 Tax=Acaulospora colombiana TaxID=27376 RepID=A0ACA9LSC9_9GLOM|nr:905_t:CDS:2 [Acaulospora colombiana]
MAYVVGQDTRCDVGEALVRLRRRREWNRSGRWSHSPGWGLDRQRRSSSDKAALARPGVLECTNVTFAELEQAIGDTSQRHGEALVGPVEEIKENRELNNPLSSSYTLARGAESKPRFVRVEGFSKEMPSRREEDRIGAIGGAIWPVLNAREAPTPTRATRHRFNQSWHPNQKRTSPTVTIHLERCYEIGAIMLKTRLKDHVLVTPLDLELKNNKIGFALPSKWESAQKGGENECRMGIQITRLFRDDQILCGEGSVGRLILSKDESSARHPEAARKGSRCLSFLHLILIENDGQLTCIHITYHSLASIFIQTSPVDWHLSWWLAAIPKIQREKPQSSLVMLKRATRRRGRGPSRKGRTQRTTALEIPPDRQGES